MKIKYLFTLLLSVLIIEIQTVKSQGYSELGAAGGVMYYMGELNPYKPFLMPKAAGAFLYRYNFNDRLAIRAQGFMGMVQADDAVSKANLERNLNFKSRIIEGSIQAEVNFLRYFIGSIKHRITPYMYGGVGFFTFKPQGFVNENWVELKPLHTEGQNTGRDRPDEYDLVSVCIPFGIGVKYSLNKYVGLGLEWGMRKTLTDYLDDVSRTYYMDLASNPNAPNTNEILASDPNKSHMDGMKRGNSKDKDWYSFAGLTVTVKLSSLKKERCLNQQNHSY